MGLNSLSAQDFVKIADIHHSIGYNSKYPGGINAPSVLHESLLDLTIPLLQKEKYTIITGTQTETMKGVFTNGGANEILTSIMLKVGVNWQYKSNRKWLFVALPKTSGTTLNFEKNSLQIGGLALHTWAKSDHLKYKAGLLYMNEFFGPFFVPILGFYWKPTERISINTSLPISGSLRFAINKKWESGITFQAYVRSFLRNYSNQQDQYLMKISNEPFIYGQYNFTDKLVLQLKAGYSIGRKLELYDVGDKADGGLMFFRFNDNRTVLNANPNDGPIVQLKLVFRYPTGE